MGQIGNRSRISRPWPVPSKGRWLWTPHTAQSSLSPCLYSSHPIHRAAARSTILTPSYCCATTFIAPSRCRGRIASFHATTTQPGEFHTYTSGDRTLWCIQGQSPTAYYRGPHAGWRHPVREWALGCSYSQRRTEPGPFYTAGVGTTVIAAICTPVPWTSAAETLWTWDGAMGRLNLRLDCWARQPKCVRSFPDWGGGGMESLPLTSPVPGLLLIKPADQELF